MEGKKLMGAVGNEPRYQRIIDAFLQVGKLTAFQQYFKVFIHIHSCSSGSRTSVGPSGSTI